MTKSSVPFAASRELCTKLQGLGTRQSVAAGTILFREGDFTRGLFLVLSGRVALSAGDDPNRVTRIAEPGSVLGLPATVRNKTYSLTAEVVADAELCQVSPQQFNELLKSDAGIGCEIVTMLAEEISMLRSLAVYRA